MAIQAGMDTFLRTARAAKKGERSEPRGEDSPKGYRNPEARDFRRGPQLTVSRKIAGLQKSLRAEELNLSARDA